MATRGGDRFVVGRDCDAYCSKCRMDLAHTIVAIVAGWPKQVKCNTCQAWHAYRPPVGQKSPPRPRSGEPQKKKKRAKKDPILPAASQETLWREALEAASAEGRPYDPRADWPLGAVIEHSKFGLGVVTKPQPPKRVQVRFRDQDRVLIMNHGR